VESGAERSVAVFPQQYRAELVRGRLLAEGIEARVRARGRRGPWQVCVASNLEAHAREVLGRDHSDLLEEVFGGELEPGDPPEERCPHCGAMGAIDLRQRPGLLYKILGTPFWAARWQCPLCRQRWR